MPDIAENAGAIATVEDAALLEAIDAGSADACAAWLGSATSDQSVHELSALSEADRCRLITILPASVAADVIELLPESLAIGALRDVDPRTAAVVIAELTSDDQADMIRALGETDAEAILAALDGSLAHDIRRLAAYDEESAGGLMLTEFLAFPDTATVRDVLADIEANADRYADYNIQYSYIVDGAGRLRGVLPIRNLLLARRATPITGVMIPDPVNVRDTVDIDELRAVFRDQPFMGLPVTDTDGVLRGVVERSHVVTATIEEADNVYRRSQGIVGGEELRSMPLFLRSRRRLAWLSVNIVLNIMAASMIAMHQDTLEAVIALAVFLPIISDMSGCSGNQAVAVTMRELTLGVTRPADVFRVFIKEASLGIINGIVLGSLIGGVAFLWKGNGYLSLVVGSSLALNTLVAVCIGGLVPLMLKKFKTDPALASGPILTTVTDMCGFFIVLTFASMMLSRLTSA